MPIQSEAEENLRVIRSLMERATVYRAISAPVAMIGGLLSLLGCGFLAMKTHTDTGEYDLPVNTFFLPTWLTVLAITALVNTYFLWHDAGRRGDVFLSPGLRAALRALCPSWLVALVLTLPLAGGSWVLPTVWMILYGLSLLATQHFAPRSIMLLGWAFLMAGLCSMLVLYYVSNLPVAYNYPFLWLMANVAMGSTFGVFHLIYAACTWPRKPVTINSGGEP